MKELIKKFIPDFLINWYHFLLAFSGAVLCGFPSKKLKVIGITGTNGKTTASEMILRIFEEAGFKTAMMNSIRFKVAGQESPNMLKMTMPGRFRVQQFLRKAVNNGCKYAVLEVTSEGIKQHRHRFINFDTAIFTNLSPEHIESHGSFEKYREAKGELFKVCKNIHIINIDDSHSDFFLQFPAKKKITYGLENGNVNRKNTFFKLSLIGDFNAYNALAAISTGLAYGIDLKICQKAVEKIKGVPGRMEQIISEPFEVVVDYAFTPAALEKVYQTMKSNILENKLICVLGACGGGRDKWKRPVLGELAKKYCDEAIITNEDPYEEEPISIINQVAKGAGDKAKKILDRREAISFALKSARKGDKIIITGKGCEPWIIERDRKIPWDDRKVAREELKKLEI